jgi:hypothetical protein
LYINQTQFTRFIAVRKEPFIVSTSDPRSLSRRDLDLEVVLVDEQRDLFSRAARAEELGELLRSLVEPEVLISVIS